MRGVHRVAEQNDVSVVPRLVRDLGKSSQSDRFEKSSRPRSSFAKKLLAEREALLLVHLVEAGGAPHRLRTLDDERRHALVIRVRVRVEEPVLGLAEGERERVEHGSVPNQTYLLPSVRTFRAEVAEDRARAIRAVRADDEVGLRKLLDLDAELQRDAQFAAPLLKNLEEPASRDRGERGRVTTAPAPGNGCRSGPSARTCP